jgi:AcrR family transcriptional regulator
MRVTPQTRAATRLRILQAAQELFTSQGFEGTTTRDLARQAEIAAGTLFNYFPSKEAVVASLAAEAVTEVHRQFEQQAPEAESFEEALFALVAAGLRRLKPLRKQLPVVLETVLSPLAERDAAEVQALRVGHLEAVARLGRRHGFEELSPVALQMYWSLYAGLLLFWANDRSPRQEDTLALLDQSLEMFVGWLRARPEDSTKNP